MKEFNKKEAIGDLLDAFTEVFYPPGVVCLSFQLYNIFFLCCVLLQEQITKPAAEPLFTQASPVLEAQEESPSEATDETWEEKEDKQNSESDGPKSVPEPNGQKNQPKEGSL